MAIWNILLYSFGALLALRSLLSLMAQHKQHVEHTLHLQALQKLAHSSAEERPLSIPAESQGQSHAA
jgi:hypothetical protein